MILLDMKIFMVDVPVSVRTREAIVNKINTKPWPQVRWLVMEAVEDTVKPWEQATWWETQIETWHEPHPAGVFNEDF